MNIKSIKNITGMISKKRFISGLLLIGGVAAGILGANMVAKASEAVVTSNQNRTRSNDFSEVVVPLSSIESEDELINLVLESGTQVLLDDSTGKMYLCYVNEDSQVEIGEIDADSLKELLQQEIDNMDVEQEDFALYGSSDSYIPREYLRGGSSQGRKRLKSEEGRQAIENARKFKQSQR